MSNLTVLSEYSSIVGLALTIVGFIFTIITILSSKKVAVEAKNAAQGVRDDLLKVDTISDLSKAIAIIEEIKRMNRSHNYNQLIERYSELCRITTTIKESNRKLPDEHIEYLQGGILHFRAQERKIEQSIATKRIIAVPQTNSVLSNTADNFTQILATLRDKEGV